MANSATFRFYGNLNDFLPRGRRHVAFAHMFVGRVNVKDAVESFGVPHPEIDLLTACGTPVAFSYRLQPADRIAAYPKLTSLDVGGVSLVRPPRLSEMRFVLDGHLGRLAAYLRLAGFDCLYTPNQDDERLADISSRDRRVLLTRDAALLKRSVIEYGYWVRHTDPRSQLAEVSSHLDLGPLARPFQRCLRCNALIERVAKEAILGRLPERTRECCDEFWQCPGCARVYWRGAHTPGLAHLLKLISVDSSQ